MSPETKILLEEFKKEFKSYKDYVDVSPWMDDVNPHPTKGYLYSNKLLTEISLIETIMKSLSKFKEDVGEDYMLKPIQVFIKDAIKIVEMHLKRIDLYKREYPLDESSGESEVKFHSDLFSQKTKTKVSLSKLNITEKETIAKSPELFFGDDNNKGKYVKAPLLMRETLSEVIPLVKTRTDNLNIDFNIPIINPATSNEMLINMKEKDIPKWDPHKHFFEQELSVIQFWQEEINKIKNGINIGGYHIHPWLYWHLNIFKFAWGSGKDKYPKNPAFRDNEYFFTEMLKIAEEDGRKGILMYGSRRISKSVVMASYLMRTLYSVRNAKCTVLGFTFNPDLKAITDYMQESITNMVPAFKINVNNNDTEKQILLGLKAKNGTDRYDHSTLSITNLEDGSKKGGQKSAGPTPDAWAMDEIAKGDCITVYNAAKPSFAGGENGKWRLTPLLAGCVCAGTKVYNHKGELKNIEDLHQDEGILGYDIYSQKLSKEPITWIQPPSEKPCYRITTRRKHVLECSYEHPILVRHRNKQEKRNEKWVRKIEFIPTEELKIGQQIVINEEVNIWGDKVMWEPRMVGWFIGDGHYGYNEVPSISSCDFEINKYISSKYNTSNKKSPSVTKNGKEFLQRRIKGTGKYLRELGIYGQTKCNKTLPINIYEYRRQDLVELLGGLFDTDGYATVGGNCPTVGFTSGCENLVIEVKNLLNKLGIHPTYNKKLYKSNELINKKSEGYNLTISDKKSLETFHKHIKFSIGYKQDNLNKIIELNKYKKEQIPSELNNCRLDTISNIEYIGVKPIYNLTAGSTNTYIANGIVTHNTAGEAALSVSAEKMLKNPEGFDLLPMNWDLLEKHVDPDSITWTRDKFPYFVPAQLSLETGDKIKTTLGDFLGEDELSPLQDIYMEKTDWIGAKKFYEEKRLKLENDIQLLASEVNSFPLKVEDCYLSTEKNKFPGLESKRRKDYIEEFGLWGEKGWVEKTYDGFYNFVIDNSKDIIWEYPYKGGNFDAPIVILDDPRPNDIEPPLGLYCIGFDDVKQDTSDGDSVISATIFKRSFEGGEWANRIVGWYDSRPDRKRDYYKNLYLLIKYFNARVLHENEDNGFIDFMETNHYDDLYIHMSDGIGLASEENFSKNKNRKWGWSPHGANIYHLEQKVVAYTKEDGIIIGDEDGLSGIDRINHPMLLYEFYKYKKGQNADRIRSFGLALTLAQYYDKTNQYIKGRKKQIEHDIDTIKKNNVKLSKGLSYTKNLVKY